MEGKVAIGGLLWDPLLDEFSLKLAKIHNQKPVKGNMIGVKVLQGTTRSELDEIPPTEFTMRMLTSREASYFDPLGIISPLLGDLRCCMRYAAQAAVKGVPRE